MASTFPRRCAAWRHARASRSRSGPVREDARRKRLRDALEAAIAFYHRVLTESHHGQPALDYMRGRGFTDETLAAHQIGYRRGRVGHAWRAA